MTKKEVVVGVQLRRISATFTLRHKPFPSPSTSALYEPSQLKKIRASSLIFPL